MNAFWRNTLLVFRMIQPNQRSMRQINGPNALWHSPYGMLPNQRQMRFLAFGGCQFKDLFQVSHILTKTTPQPRL